MDFVFHHVMKLEDIHKPDGNFLIERLAGASVEEFDLTGLLEPRFDQLCFNLILGGAGERRHNRLIVKGVSGQTKMHLKNLTQIHAGRHPKRCENDIDGSTIGHVRHVFDR